MSRTCIWERERDVPGGTNSLSKNWHIIGITGSIHQMRGCGRRHRERGGGEEASTLFVPLHQKDQQNLPHGDRRDWGRGTEANRRFSVCEHEAGPTSRFYSDPSAPPAHLT